MNGKCHTKKLKLCVTQPKCLLNISEIRNNRPNLDSRALLRMTARERRALGSPDTSYVCDWFTTGTMKALVIGQFEYARKI